MSFDKAEYAEWVAGLRAAVDERLAAHLAALEEHGPGAIYGIVTVGEEEQFVFRMAKMAGLDSEAISAGIKMVSVGGFVLRLMDAYEAKHGPVDWAEEMERRYKRAAVQVAAEEEAAGA